MKFARGLSENDFFIQRCVARLKKILSVRRVRLRFSFVLRLVLNKNPIPGQPLGLLVVIVLFLFTGCQTVSQPKAETESRKDVREALGTITQAISGKQLSKEELKNLTKDLRTNKDARSAIQSITDSMSRKTVKVKYCPVTGRRYAPRVVICPVHKVKLKLLEE